MNKNNPILQNMNSNNPSMIFKREKVETTKLLSKKELVNKLQYKQTMDYTAIKNRIADLTTHQWLLSKNTQKNKQKNPTSVGKNVEKLDPYALLVEI